MQVRQEGGGCGGYHLCAVQVWSGAGWGVHVSCVLCWYGGGGGPHLTSLVISHAHVTDCHMAIP